MALANGLKVIFCIGEVLEEREAGKQNEVVKHSSKGSLFDLTGDEFSNIILAYETGLGYRHRKKLLLRTKPKKCTHLSVALSQKSSARMQLKMYPSCTVKLQAEATPRNCLQT